MIIRITILLSVLILSANDSKAIFEFEATEFFGGGMSSELIATSPPAVEGDMDLMFCATLDDGANFFNQPTPNWTEVVKGECGGNPGCILGIWRRLSDGENGETNTCSWNIETLMSQLAVGRLSGADTENPIIDTACASGVSSEAIAPPVNSEFNSLVMRIFAAPQPFPVIPTPPPFFGTPTPAQRASFGFGGGGTNPQEDVSFFYYVTGRLVEIEGDTLPKSLNLSESGPWGACTATIRMKQRPETAPIPTMNEWGFIAVAIFLGIAGFLHLRKKQQAI